VDEKVFVEKGGSLVGVNMYIRVVSFDVLVLMFSGCVLVLL
jgi:hypothetical protein